MGPERMPCCLDPDRFPLIFIISLYFSIFFAKHLLNFTLNCFCLHWHHEIFPKSCFSVHVCPYGCSSYPNITNKDHNRFFLVKYFLKLSIDISA